ncbi:zinc transporter ZIP9 isoform X1 [Sphaeramia orbicularis]|uniref:zinc transporter ZIP9 isoform X1 n=1 Tax=Sphaeramia orbicularis TaxID=375764 RepID=UPI00117BE98C|nr:zinc transporter ZIP9-like isoform X1 [Sphaeramia orbicularis]
MDGGLTITLISVAMFIGCFLLGFIPLLFRLSETSMKYITILGAGLLCGTALSIIIPEGVGLIVESLTDSAPVPTSLNNSETNVTSINSGPRPQFLIGVALTFGFILMFIVDQIGGYLSTRGKSSGFLWVYLHHISLSITHLLLYCLISGRIARSPISIGITATLGLVIHAAADGFALGAAVATSEVTVQVIVFLAVILHKAPAAFGLVSFLMHSGLEKKYIQGHLLAFSAAAPIVAIITYFILHASGSLFQHSSTGMGMLFSAGTFLYVATVHVLPEISSSRTEPPQGELQQQQQQQQTTGGYPHQHRYLGLLETMTLIFGVALTVVLARTLNDD